MEELSPLLDIPRQMDTPRCKDELADTVTGLERCYAGADAQTVVTGAIRDEFVGQIALVSSFGSNAAVLLHMVAQADPKTPVLFLDTGKHFGETLRYRDALAEQLGLERVRVIQPDEATIRRDDSQGILWAQQPDRCCFIHKVAPLRGALAAFDAWLNGRRRQQGAARSSIRRFEAMDGRVKINPLFDWSAADIDSYFAKHRLPRHPLEEDGFRSIGCLKCTERTIASEDARAGRWRGKDKTECGIHLPIRSFKDFGAGI